MKPAKFFITVAFYLFLAIAGFLIGYQQDANETQIECNEFIIETYYDMSYDECLERCEAFSEVLIDYQGQQIKPYQKNKYLLPFDINLTED